MRLSQVLEKIRSESLSDVSAGLAATRALHETTALAVILVAQMNGKVDRTAVDVEVAKLNRPGISNAQVVSRLTAAVNAHDKLSAEEYGNLKMLLQALAEPGERPPLRVNGRIDLASFIRRQIAAGENAADRRALSRELNTLRGKPRRDVAELTKKLRFLAPEFAAYPREDVVETLKRHRTAFAVAAVVLLALGGFWLTASRKSEVAAAVPQQPIEVAPPNWGVVLNEALKSEGVKEKLAGAYIVVLEHRGSADTLAVLTQMKGLTVVRVGSAFGLPAHGFGWIAAVDPRTVVAVPDKIRVILVNTVVNHEGTEQLVFNDTSTGTTSLAVTMLGKSVTWSVGAYLDEAGCTKTTPSPKARIAIRKAESVAFSEQEFASIYRTEATLLKTTGAPPVEIEAALVRLIGYLNDADVQRINPAEFGVTKTVAELAPKRVGKK